MRHQRKVIHFCSVESLQSHTDTQLPVQKCSAEHEDAFWKALLGLASGRQGHSSGVWPSSRWQLLRVPAACWSTESLGLVGLGCLGRTGPPPGLAHLGGTMESGRWAGWARHTTDGGPTDNHTAPQRSRAMGPGQRGVHPESRGHGEHGKGLFREAPSFVPTLRMSPS